MTDLHTVRATGPEDLLALVPTLLGFHPDRSVVVLTVGAAVRPVHARVDLPARAEHGEEADDLAEHLARVAARSRVTAVAIVVYTADAAVARTTVDALARRMADVGVEVACVVRADGSRWWSMHPDGEEGGVPYDVSSHPLVVRSVVSGTVVLGSRQQLVDSLRGDDDAESREIAALAEGLCARLEAETGGRAPLEAPEQQNVPAALAEQGEWLRDRVCCFLEDGRRLEAAEVARLSGLVTASSLLRDVAWAEMTQSNASRQVDLWRDVVRRVPPRFRPAPAGLLGFAAWLTGNGALAWCAVECAAEAEAETAVPGAGDAEPGHSLAGLLAQVLAAAVAPSAWRPPDPPQLGGARQ
ncbi:MAG TPA: DUF4192 domain-containing protein [Nocardioidaceae bacterium]|nr:DUF4192 domain-containing protein [Nocardioidaceae bacterium]